MYTIYKAFIALIVVISAALILGQASAQTPNINITILRSIQNPSNLRFEIRAVVDSNIYSDRVSLEWELPEGVYSDDSLTNETFVLLKGRNYFSINAWVTGTIKGSVRLHLKAYLPSKIYSVTQKAEIETNAQGELYPITQEYKYLSIANTIRLLSIGMFISCIFSLVVIRLMQTIMLTRKPIRVIGSTEDQSQILKTLNEKQNAGDVIFPK